MGTPHERRQLQRTENDPSVVKIEKRVIPDFTQDQLHAMKFWNADRMKAYATEKLSLRGQDDTVKWGSTQKLITLLQDESDPENESNLLLQAEMTKEDYLAVQFSVLSAYSKLDYFSPYIIDLKNGIARNQVLLASKILHALQVDKKLSNVTNLANMFLGFKNYAKGEGYDIVLSKQTTGRVQLPVLSEVSKSVDEDKEPSDGELHAISEEFDKEYPSA